MLGMRYFGTFELAGIVRLISDSEHEVDALGHAGDEGRTGHERVR